MSALENVLAGPLYAQGRSRAQAEPEARALLARVGMAPKLDARPEKLSGGEQQRVAIARALAVKPQAILFDEPTSALDPTMAAEVMAVMADLARDGLTMVVVTHSMDFARNAATTVHVMSQGQIAESGPPAEVFDTPRSEAVRTFLKDVRKGG
jgi:ABC-type polar amino acid transport system ATPase subunit